MKIFNVFQIYGDGDSYTTFRLIGHSKSVEGAQKVITNYIEKQDSTYQKVIQKIKDKTEYDLFASVFIEMTDEEKHNYRGNKFHYHLLPEMNAENNFSVISNREDPKNEIVDYHHFFNGFLIEEAELLD